MPGKTPTKMDVAPWDKYWIKRESDGFGLYLMVFVEIQWYSMVLGSDTEQHSQLLQSFAYITVNMSNVCATFGI